METIETKPGRPIWPVVLPLAAFGVLAGFLAYMLLIDDRDPSFMPSALIGEPAPSVAGPSLIAGADDVTNMLFGTGSPVLVNFFASWCGPCKIEHPVLTGLAEDEGLTVVGVNYKDQPDAALAFLAEFGNPYAEVATDRTGSISVDWGVTGLPETFIVDGDGVVIYRHFGPVLPQQRDDLLAVLENAS